MVAIRDFAVSKRAVSRSPVAPVALDCNLADRDAAPLFDYLGIDLPMLRAPVEAAKIAPMHPEAWGWRASQLPLLYQPVEFDDTVSGWLLPHCRHALSRHLHSMVPRKSPLAQLALRLAAQRKLLLGDVIQMTHAEIFELADRNAETVEGLLALLMDYDLRLNTRVRGWTAFGGVVSEIW